MECSLDLCKISSSDLELIMKWRMTPEVTKYMLTDPVLTIEGQMKWYEVISEEKDCIYWLIRCNKEPIGLLGITSIYDERGHLTWYIGEKEYRGLGIGKIVLQNVVDHLFSKNKLFSIVSEVFDANVNAKQLYEDCGFVENKANERKVAKYGSEFSLYWLEIDKIQWESKNSKSFIKINIEE